MGHRRNVLLLAFPAFGHYLPTIELAKRILPFHDVTVAISASKRAGIRDRKVEPPSSIPLDFVEDHISVSFDAPLDIQMYVAIVRAMEPYYQQYVENLLAPDITDRRVCSEHCSSQANGRRIDAVFWDYAITLPKAWETWGIPIYVFCSMSATVMLQWLTMTTATPAMPDSDFLRDSKEVAKEQLGLMPESIGNLWMDKSPMLCKATALLVNSFPALEINAVDQFAAHPNTSQLPVKYIGPILTETSTSDNNRDLADNIRNWLDKEDKPVVYVSLGTVALASPQQLEEIGQALLSLEIPFIWALRHEQQAHLSARFSRCPSNAFTHDSPYLILTWVPQQAVLKHHSTAAFISHCGWNSSLEAISYGVPVVCLPLFADQHDNAGMLVDLGVGVRLAPLSGLGGTRVITAQEVADAVRSVVSPRGQGRTSYAVRAQHLAEQAQLASREETLAPFLEIMDQLAQ